MFFRSSKLIPSALSILQVLLFVLFSGCYSDRRKTDTIQVVDDLGREVELPGRIDRIVSLAPAATEILFYIGAGERVVGVTRFCDFPSRVSEIAETGDFLNPNIERILGLSPSIVFLTSFVQENTLYRLESFGIPAFVSYPATVDSLPGSMTRMARACGIAEEAKSTIDLFEQELAAVKKEAAAARAEHGPVSVYFEIATAPLMSISDESFEGSLVNLAGGISCSGALPRKYALFSAERIIAADPDVIVLAHEFSTAGDVASRKGWAGIKAVRHGRIVTAIDENLLVRPGPRVLEGAKRLAAAFYPDYSFTWLRGVD